MSTIYAIKFNIKNMIEHFGGVNGTISMMQKAGVPIKAKTLQKQKERGNIHSDLVATLIYAARVTGYEFEPYDFLERNE